MKTFTCPLCGYNGTNSYYADRYRSYRYCEECHLVFVPPAERPNIITEKAGYDDAHNRPVTDDHQTLASQLIEKLTPGALGLDFGSGPEPLLASLFRKAGMRVRTYDVFYDPDSSVWYQQYDFITCASVLEHLHNPGREINRLFSILKPGGWLAIRTNILNGHAFEKYDGSPDLTRVCFFSDDTFRWLAAHHDVRLTQPTEDLVFLQKKN